MSIEINCNKNYSTPAGVEFLKMLIAINIQTLWVCNYSKIITYISNLLLMR